jgi:hypothetical protein
MAFAEGQRHHAAVGCTHDRPQRLDAEVIGEPQQARRSMSVGPAT